MFGVQVEMIPMKVYSTPLLNRSSGIFTSPRSLDRIRFFVASPGSFAFHHERVDGRVRELLLLLFFVVLVFEPFLVCLPQLPPDLGHPRLRHRPVHQVLHHLVTSLPVLHLLLPLWVFLVRGWDLTLILQNFEISVLNCVIGWLGGILISNLGMFCGGSLGSSLV